MEIFKNSRLLFGRSRSLCMIAQRKVTNLKHIKKVENGNINTKNDMLGKDLVDKQDKPKMNEKDTLTEAHTKSRMTTHRTMFNELVKDSAPEDEEAILEYYVRKAQDYMETYDEAEYFDILASDKRLFFKMIDMWIQDAGEVKRGHREFVQVAMNNLNRFNVQHEHKAYLKILECYPRSEHTGLKRNEWFNAVWQDKILDHELAERLVSIMNKNQVAPNDDMYDVFTSMFGMYSRATAYLRNLMFWYPRLTSFSKFPITHQELEKMSQAEVSVRALRQLCPGLDSTYNHFKVDPSLHKEEEEIELEHEYITSIQSDTQKKLLEKHDISQPVFVDGPHMVYFSHHRVQYYILRGDQVKTKTTDHHILTDKAWWMKFYGKDFLTSKSFVKAQQLYFEDSFLPAMEIDDELSNIKQKNNEVIEVSGDTKLIEGNVYAIVAANSQSLGMLRSWIKNLGLSNPCLSQFTVVFNENLSFLSSGYLKGPSKFEDDFKKA